MSLVIPISAGSLGDWLSLTPLLAAAPGSTVIAQDSPHTRQFATLYEGLAKVEFSKEAVADTPVTDEVGPVSRRILNYYGFRDFSPIPVVRLLDYEFAWAREFLSKYPNPIAFNNTTASARRDKPEHDICNYRRMPDVLSGRIIRTLYDGGYTVIRFGCKGTMRNIYDNYDRFPGIVNLLDLNLRQLAACYHVIGRYGGTQTGDLHLALASGVKELYVFVPPSCFHYDYDKHHYDTTELRKLGVNLYYDTFQ